VKRASGWIKPTLRILALILGLLLLTACQRGERLDQLDLEAERMIEQRQAAVLGPGASSEADPVPGRVPLVENRSIYNTNPATVNPASSEIDLNPASPREAWQYPAILDDGTDPATARFDLDALLAYAIANAPEYRSEKEELFLATLGLIVERHLWGPRFFAAVTGQLTGEVEDNDSDTALSVIGSVGVTQRLPYGGSVSATALADYVSFLRQASTTSESYDTSTGLRFSLDLPLLRGAGKNSSRYNNRIQAERDLIYAVRDFDRFRREFLVDIASTYFDILRRQRQLANRERQLVSLDRLTNQFNALAEAGRVPPFQAERAEQRVLFRRNSLLNQQENYTRTLEQLKLRIGMDVTRPLEIVPVSVTLPRPEINLEASIELAYQQRLDLQNERDRVDDSRRDVRVARNQLGPDLDLEADLILPTTSATAEPTFDLDPGESEYDIALTLDLPLDREIELADYRASLVRLERQRRSFRTEADRVALDVRRAVRAIEQALYTLDLQERNVEIAQRRNIQIKLNQRSLGAKEVIDAEEDLLDARDLYDAALSSLQSSILDYLLGTGQLRVDAQGRWQAPEGLMQIEADGEPTPLNAGFPIQRVEPGDAE
jgi:outer membrane protein TolC